MAYLLYVHTVLSNKSSHVYNSIHPALHFQFKQYLLLELLTFLLRSHLSLPIDKLYGYKLYGYNLYGGSAKMSDST